MCSKQRPYFSYLLSMWQVQETDKLVWRASLENPHTGEKHFFATLHHLYKFLISGRTASQKGQEVDETDTDQALGVSPEVI